MTSNDIDAVRKGWTVKASDGEKLGSVETVTDTAIEVHRGFINRDTIYVPLARLEHVRPDDDEIEIDLPSDEVEQQDWSRPPTHGPRTHGAPLNAPGEREGDADYPRRDIAYQGEAEEEVEDVSYSYPEERPATVGAGDASDPAGAPRDEERRRRQEADPLRGTGDVVDEDDPRQAGPRRRF